MQNRREFDEKIKKDLLDKYGMGEFKASWEELSEAINLDLPKTKYHIFKLEQLGFLRVVNKSRRSGGYTSPNTIRIIGDADIVEENTGEVFNNINKYITMLETKVRNIEEKDRVIAAKDEVIRNLQKENQILEAQNKRYAGEQLDLYRRISELNNPSHGG